MNGQDLYEGLRYVDPAMLEEAMEPVKRPKRRRYLPLAACLCLLLAGTAVAVFSHVEIRLLDVEHLEDYREADPSMGVCEERIGGRSISGHRRRGDHIPGIALRTGTGGCGCGHVFSGVRHLGCGGSVSWSGGAGN